MKTSTKTIALVLGFGLITSTAVMAKGYGNGQARGINGSGMGQRGAAISQEMRSDMYQARYEVLAELSGKSVDTIKEESTNKPFYSLMNDYKVDRVAFQKAMHEKAKISIEKEVKAGNLTQDQADRMLQRMQYAEQRGQQKMRGQGRRGMHGGQQGFWN